MPALWDNLHDFRSSNYTSDYVTDLSWSGYSDVTNMETVVCFNQRGVASLNRDGSCETLFPFKELNLLPI